MYTHSKNTTFPRADYLLDQQPPYPDMIDPLQFLSGPPPPLAHLIIPDQFPSRMELGYGGGGHSSSSSAGTGCSSYGSPTSQTSCDTTHRPNYMQRSISSHSLPKNGHQYHFASPQDFWDMDISPVRRVFSAGDLPHGHRAESPLSRESSMIIESMTKASKYSPEEKKERIERYRSKRSQRNFNKKIKYACRKTLADSRPRIRGRFARNDEIEKNPQLLQWSNVSGEEDEDYDDNWVNFVDAISANSIP